ncbi:MAG: DnaD domain protein [Dehalococcoidia bacterium]
MPGGFPRDVRSTPVPNPLLAGLLEEMDDLAELKVTLRVIWMLHSKRGFPTSVTAKELCADRTVAVMLRAAGEELERYVMSALDMAVDRGTLIRVQQAAGPDLYFLNTDPVRRTLASRYPAAKTAPAEGMETWPDLEAASPKPTVFTFYEQNIGPLTPWISERISEALENHSERNIVDAISVAVENNARNWNYVSAILGRWAEEGRPDGEPGRDPETPGTDNFYRRYVERQRARGNQ